MGLPGPENTQSAPVIAGATSTSRPTLRAKYPRARAEMSARFSWKAYGVSSSTARAPARSVRAAARWISTMVGLVSPDPISTSKPGISLGLSLARPRLQPGPPRSFKTRTHMPHERSCI
ncbi:hypothetical protein ACFQ0B_60895 [Nonomuraea thailandensis]